MIKTASIGLTLLSAAALASALPSSPTPIASPGPAATSAPVVSAASLLWPLPELELLKPVTGNWTCDGNVPESLLGPARKTSSAQKSRNDLDNRWVTGLVIEKSTPENPRPRKGKFHWTWDAVAKRFHGMWIDNTGAWGTYSSPGWQDQKLIWTGDAVHNGEKIQTRDTFESKSSREMTQRSEISVKGQWTLVYEGSCRRGPGVAASPRPALSPVPSPMPSPAPKQK